MIRVTRMDGQQLFLNCDLIEWIESVPDTIVVMQSGKKVHCAETPTEIVTRVVEFRRRLLAAAEVRAAT